MTVAARREGDSIEKSGNYVDTNKNTNRCKRLGGSYGRFSGTCDGVDTAKLTMVDPCTSGVPTVGVVPAGSAGSAEPSRSEARSVRVAWRPRLFFGQGLVCRPDL